MSMAMEQGSQALIYQTDGVGSIDYRGPSGTRYTFMPGEPRYVLSGDASHFLTLEGFRLANFAGVGPGGEPELVSANRG